MRIGSRPAKRVRTPRVLLAIVVLVLSVILTALPLRVSAASPSLLSYAVTPPEGYFDTYFNFTVKYRDNDGDCPQWVNVVVQFSTNETTYSNTTMSATTALDPIQCKNGVDYYAVLTGLPAGPLGLEDYIYYFETLNDNTTANEYRRAPMPGWEKHFLVYNSPPLISLEIEPRYAIVNETVTFTINVSDIDNDDVVISLYPDYSNTSNFLEKTVNNTAVGVSVTFNYTYSEVGPNVIVYDPNTNLPFSGSYTVGAKAQDFYGNLQEIQLPVYVNASATYPNFPPFLRDPGSGIDAEWRVPESFLVVVQDVNDDDLHVKFDFGDGDFLVVEVQHYTQLLAYPYERVNISYVYWNWTYSELFGWELKQTEKDFFNQTVYYNGTIDGDHLLPYNLSVRDGLMINASHIYNPVFNEPLGSNGSVFWFLYNLTITADDLSGLANHTVEVVSLINVKTWDEGPTLPQIHQMPKPAMPGHVQINKTTWFGATSIDPNRNQSVYFYWDFDSTVDTNGDNITNNDAEAVGEKVNWTFTQLGNYTITLWATDDVPGGVTKERVVFHNKSATYTVTVVYNSPPNAIFSVGTVQLDTPILLHAVGLDIDGDNLTFGWDFGDGTSAANVTSPPPENLAGPQEAWQWHTFTQPCRAVIRGANGSYCIVYINVTVDDGEGHTLTLSQKVNVTSTNTPPVIESVQINAQTIHRNEDLNITLVLKDYDGDNITVIVQWGDGSSDERIVRNETSQNVTVVFTHTYSRLGQYNVTIIITDGKVGVGNHTLTQKTIVTVENPTVVVAREWQLYDTLTLASFLSVVGILAAVSTLRGRREEEEEI